ncbi:Crp/Fnr family transcriptional regulator [Shewanella sp. VB17]|uniref:Crp/Fnr family transcriptional regulator n=1 Tax=Shewanella sp. VB17 TaxID=2739432 RepID=UPI00156382E1|nr:Crp/Fnr family transcriptional regulator [Shewanella sp. VB17]NRD74940.1 Crp/Fnr family transcriptional regulator [Shewanella sp. VB17]
MTTLLPEDMITLTHFLSTLGLPKTIEVNTLNVNKLSLNGKRVLLAQNSQQRYGYFILSGILKACHFDKQGVERCKEFYFAGELCFLYHSWLTDKPAQYQIETLDKACVVQIPLGLLALPEWLPAQLSLLKRQLLFKEQKEAFLLLKNPEQRYQHLLNFWPLWVEKLNNIQLASYIGISPVSLSRLKSRLLR